MKKKSNHVVVRRHSQPIKKFCLLLVLGSMSMIADGEGFRNSTIGTSDLGRSGGRIAQVDDATAVQQNPANLVGIANPEAQLTPSVIYINVDYQSPLGQSASTIHPWKVLPNFFVAMPLKNDRYAVGLGVTVPYGLADQWRSSASAFIDPTSFRYTTPSYSQLITINVNPSAAVKLTDSLSLGAGLDVMWSDLEFKQFLPGAGPTFQAHAEGDGVGLGGNVGLTWQVTGRQRLALTYRSTMTVDYSGTTKFDNLPGIPSTSFNSQIKYPNIIAAGYGVQLTDKVRVETDFEWLQFSQFRNLPVKIGANPAIGAQSLNTAENWKTTFTAVIGGDWQFADHWGLRAGYEYFESQGPDATFTPTIPDANQNVFTIGLGWKGRHSSLEAAYGLDFYNERNITHDQNSPAFNGKYSFNVHLISLAYNYSF